MVVESDPRSGPSSTALRIRGRLPEPDASALTCPSATPLKRTACAVRRRRARPGAPSARRTLAGGKTSLVACGFQAPAGAGRRARVGKTAGTARNLVVALGLLSKLRHVDIFLARIIGHRGGTRVWVLSSLRKDSSKGRLILNLVDFPEKQGLLGCRVPQGIPVLYCSTGYLVLNYLYINCMGYNLHFGSHQSALICWPASLGPLCQLTKPFKISIVDCSFLT